MIVTYECTEATCRGAGKCSCTFTCMTCGAVSAGQPNHPAGECPAGPVVELIPLDAVIHNDPTRDNPCFCGKPECPDSGGLS